MLKKVQSRPTALISKALGLSTKRVRQLYDRGMPTTVDAARKWYDENIDKTQSKHTGSESLQRLRDAKASSAEIERRLNELKVAKLEGAVIEFERAKTVVLQVIETQRHGYRMLEALYAQAFSMSAEQRAEWNQKWNTTEQQIAAKLSAWETTLRS